MRKEFAGIVSALEITHPFAQDLRRRVLALCNSQGNAIDLIEDLEHNEEEDDCRNNSALYALLKSCVHDKLKNKEASIAAAVEAISGFRNCGNDFNEAMAHWFIGLLYHVNQEDHLAIPSLVEANGLLERCIRFHEAESNYAKKRRCESCVRKITRTIKSFDAKRVEKSESRTYPSHLSKIAQLIYGVYDIGHASRVGKFIWDDSLIGQLSIDAVKFDDVPHYLYNLREGNEIHMNNSGDYRLLKIDGDSMNQAKPFPINPGDYILADLKLNPQHGNIVVARLNNPPTPAERAGVVKRLTSKGLRSESTKHYDDIPLTDADVRGVVIAIAKPVNQSKSKPSKSAQRSAAKNEDGYQLLLNMAHGDKDLVERLIQHEHQNNPIISRTEAINRAITHWQRDNL